MSDSTGYQVSATELDSFANYLQHTTVSEIATAATGVTSANGFDVNAFGVILGQAMGVPCRIAMGVVASQLHGLSQKISTTATNTKTTATQYSNNDATIAGSFTNLRGN
jgi:hypothetical protein